jgi:cytochrome c oxidase subunit 4
MLEHNHHIVPVRTLVIVFVALMGLAVVTIAVAFFDFGIFNKGIALSIAVTKAALIMLFFMNLRHSSKLIWIFAGLGFFGLAIMIIIAMGDYVARGGVIVPDAAPYFQPFLQ